MFGHQIRQTKERLRHQLNDKVNQSEVIRITNTQRKPWCWQACRYCIKRKKTIIIISQHRES